MPGWHNATKELQETGEIQMVGIIQEQHAERARLFMQWKQMDWPVLVDSLDLLDVSVVPITLTIDAQGIIRQIQPSLSGNLDALFPDSSNDPVTLPSTPTPQVPDLDAMRPTTGGGTAAGWRHYGQALYLWGGKGRESAAIDALQTAIDLQPGHGPTVFRLGVAYRARYDTGAGSTGDFSAAVAIWSQALDIDPNNYIWRRRIQQYGPRLHKPYPFYDWVAKARQEILARGQQPVTLGVEPAGAELATPASSFPAAAVHEDPDPEGRITRDDKKLVMLEATVVPRYVEPGETARVHLVFRPRQRVKAHWNNEVDDLLVAVTAPAGWNLDSSLLTAANPQEPLSQETRHLEFEVQAPATVKGGEYEVSGYALYYVCEDVNGACLYRRQDFQVPLSTTGVEKAASETVEAKTLSILAGGDVTLGYHLPEFLEELRLRGGFSEDELIAYPFRHISEVTTAADLFWVNLEGVLTRHDEPISKSFNFRADPSDVSILKTAGVDVVSLANNHAFDFGAQGLEETLATLATAGIAAYGAGADLSRARQPAIVERQGRRLGFLGYLYLGDHSIEPEEIYALDDKPGVAGTHGNLPLLLRWVREDILALRPQVDLVLVSFHWGRELRNLTEPYQRFLAQEAVAAGADLVVGHHPHCLQGFEILDTTPVAYSLGNLVFAGSWSPTRKDAALLEATASFLPSRKPELATRFLPLSVDHLPEYPFQPYLHEVSQAARVRRLLGCYAREQVEGACEQSLEEPE